METAERKVWRSLRDSFNHTLRRHRRNDSRDLVAAGVEQGAELSLSAFSSSGHHQHIQIDNLTETVRIGVRHNRFYQQDSSIRSHGSAAVPQNPDAVVVIPVVEDTA